MHTKFTLPSSTFLHGTEVPTGIAEAVRHEREISNAGR